MPCARAVNLTLLVRFCFPFTFTIVYRYLPFPRSSHHHTPLAPNPHAAHDPTRQLVLARRVRALSTAPSTDSTDTPGACCTLSSACAARGWVLHALLSTRRPGGCCTLLMSRVSTGVNSL